MDTLSYNHAYAPLTNAWDDETFIQGPAIFTKHEILNTENFLLSANEPRAAVRADIKVGDKTLHVFSTHLLHTHQKESETQTEQVESLIKLLSHENTIVMGDFNATPSSSTIQSMRKILKDSDLTAIPTWSMYPEGCLDCVFNGLDTKLDYIFTTPDIKVDLYQVGKSKASDHLPIIAEIEI